MSEKPIYEYEVIADRVITLTPSHITVIPGRDFTSHTDLSAFEGIYVRRKTGVVATPAKVEAVAEEPVAEEPVVEMLVDSPSDVKLEKVSAEKEAPKPKQPRVRKVR